MGGYEDEANQIIRRLLEINRRLIENDLSRIEGEVEMLDATVASMQAEVRTFNINRAAVFLGYYVADNKRIKPTALTLDNLFGMERVQEPTEVPTYLVTSPEVSELFRLAVGVLRLDASEDVTVLEDRESTLLKPGESFTFIQSAKAPASSPSIRITSDASHNYTKIEFFLRPKR